MNRRIYKKKCKRAVELLSQNHGMPANCFETSTDQDDDISSHQNVTWFKKTRSENELGIIAPLKGTPILVERDYYYGECDVNCVLDRLQQVQSWDISEKQADRRYSKMGN